MITSGWVLPDMYEVECKTCTQSKSHSQVVKQYLSKLKKRDYNCYEEIIHEFFKLRSERKVLDLEDFAVIKLGWLKVIDEPLKIVFCSCNSPLELLAHTYENLGYSRIISHNSIHIINICIPSQELI